MSVTSLRQHITPPAAIARILNQFDRAQIEGFIEVAIGLLDMADGDPDIEEDDGHEDDDPAEDDDPGGGDILDEPHDQEDGFLLFYGVDQTRPISPSNPMVP